VRNEIKKREGEKRKRPHIEGVEYTKQKKAKTIDRHSGENNNG